MFNTRKTSGFTLVELSIVLAIVSVFLGMILLSTEARIAEAKIYSTKEKMQVILDALDKYVKTYGALPCPTNITLSRDSANYGKGLGSNNINPPGGDPAGACIGSITLANFGGTVPITAILKGGIPFKDLGLDADAVVDGWGNRFTYIINQDNTTFISFRSGLNPQFEKIQLFSDAAATVPIVGNLNGTVTRDRAILLIISHGANGYGAYLDKDGSQLGTSGASAPEIANANSVPISFPPGPSPKFYAITPNKDFDDIVIYRTRWQFPPYFYQQ